jgi:ABC-type transport system involved in cytochrome c biogenesis permease component
MQNIFAWYWNPVFQREMLTRWRHPTSFILVVAYALVIAAGVGWQLFDAPRGQSEAELGHSIWQTLVITQTIGWMVLGPVLTAGSIAGEREKGHLEALILSPLTSREIVTGKMLGALSLVVLLLLVPLPAIALCFLLGGVSPLEFIASFVLNFSTALSGLGFGLVASAQSRDTGQGVSKALWRALGAYLLMVLPCCFPFFNPLVAILTMISSKGTESEWLLISSFIFLLVHGFIAHGQLTRAFNEVSKPVDVSLVGSAPERPHWESIPIQEQIALPHGAKSRAPLWLRFNNPVLQREARRYLAFKWSNHSGTNDMALGCATLVFAGYVVPLSLVAWFDPAKCKSIWWMIAYPWLLCACVAAALSAAGTFTREREGGHWASLWLTPLRHGEIIGGKLSGVLFGIGFYSLWLLPFWIPCILVLPFSLTATTFLSALGAIWLAANIGLFFSALFRKTGTALNWTILTLLVWWMAQPPWKDWQSTALSAAFGHALLLISLGELLYLGTHRILHRAPYER